MKFVPSAVQKLGTVVYVHELAKSFGDEIEGENVIASDEKSVKFIHVSLRATERSVRFNACVIASDEKSVKFIHVSLRAQRGNL